MFSTSPFQIIINIFLSIKEFCVLINPFYKSKNIIQDIDLNNWELSFYDDFDGNEIDESHWMTHYYWGTSMIQLDNQQTYSNCALTVSDSCLYITPQNHRLDGWYYKDGTIVREEFPIISGMIHSGDSFKQKYGIFSMRCKLPKGSNILPSAWLLDKQSWPPKLDLFEFDSHSGKKIEYGVDWGLEYTPYHFQFRKKVWTQPLIDDFHIFTCKWSPNKIKWYIDNRLVAVYCGNGIPQTPMYIVINLALNQKSDEYNNMIIDWVKTWKIRIPDND